jgi:hypothetical protein
MGDGERPFLTHPWLDTLDAGDCIGIFLPDSEIKDAEITIGVPAMSLY